MQGLVREGKEMLTHFSLCTGIGGIDLAAEQAGFQTVGQCEIDEYASKVLAKNFKGVPNLHDIRTVTVERLRENGIDPNGITVLSAGFPCQPYSLAGKGKGDRDERDLWGEVARCVSEIKPAWFVGENTPGLFSRANQRYFARVLHDLSALGYSVGWGVWGACDVGAPHRRDRVFIVARNTDGKYDEAQREVQKKDDDAGRICGKIPDAACERCGTGTIQPREFAESGRTENEWGIQIGGVQSRGICCGISNAACVGLGKQRQSRYSPTAGGRQYDYFGREKKDDSREWWEAEPDVGRVVDGISSRVDRLRCLGNAVVPKQIYPVFEAIAEYERRRAGGEES